jgi:hypothetical protein
MERSTSTDVVDRAPSMPDEGARAVRTLDRISATVPDIQGIWTRDVQPGDWIVVRTLNSVYTAAALGDGSYRMAGGWFATEGRGDSPVRISGCTWGGSVIHTGLVAAPGMFLEFANGVRTTRIREVRLIRRAPGREH